MLTACVFIESEHQVELFEMVCWAKKSDRSCPVIMILRSNSFTTTVAVCLLGDAWNWIPIVAHLVVG